MNRPALPGSVEPSRARMHWCYADAKGNSPMTLCGCPLAADHAHSEGADHASTLQHHSKGELTRSQYRKAVVRPSIRHDPATRFSRRGIAAMVLTTASLVVAGYVLARALYLG